MSERERTDGWELLREALVAAKELEALYYGSAGFTPNQLRAASDRFAQTSAAWKALLDAELKRS